MSNLLNDRLNDETPETKKEKKLQKKQERKKITEENKKKKKETETVIVPKTEEQVKEVSKKEDIDSVIEAASGEDYILEQKKLKRSRKKYYFFKIFICFMCGYLLFLIYGVLVTNYDYDEKGNVVAQIMTKDDIEKQKEYSTLLGYYIDARTLYEKILVINYRFDKSPDDAIDLVPEYESLLDESNRILVQLKAFSPSKAYTPAYNLLVTWVNADLSSFLQEISAALSQSSAEHMANAINDKERMYNDCYQLTANMISLGEKVKGVDISTLKEWSPEEYIKEEMGDV